MLQSSSQPFATGYTDGQLGIVNPAYCQLVGYSEEELRSIKWNADLTAPEWFAAESQMMAKLISTGKAVSYEKEYIHKEGHRIPVEVLAHIRRGESGAPDTFFAFVTDLTEQKRAEKEAEQLNRQLLQAQKMESVGRLAGGVAHDFNNMLSVILGYAHMAFEKASSGSPLREDMQEIINAAKRSAEITRQLLAFARKQEMTPRIIDLNGAVNGMCKMLQRLIGEDIYLTWHPGSGLGAVKIDPSQVDQILANLCVNARDAIDGVGMITIETDMVSCDADYCALHADAVPGEYVMLSVSDNGQGMTPDIMENIFEPFFTTKELGQGTGLGLATVCGIVKQNNGYIQVYSELDSGTTFKVYLPLCKDETAGEQAGDWTQQDLCGHETILVVEDELAILKVIVKMLQKIGYTVLAAESPGAAINLVKEREGDINLVITDVIMPEMNGRDLSEKLLSIVPQIKCMYMSGYTANVINQQGVLGSGAQFIQKPFTKHELAMKVRQVLDGESKNNG